MNRRHARLTAALASATIAWGGATVAGVAQAAPDAADPASPVTLSAPTRLVVYSYENQVYTDLGLRLIAQNEAFELWSGRATYDDQISTVWRTSGGDVALPEGTMTDFSGLADFVTVKVRRVSDGSLAGKWRQDACLNGDAQRIRPDAPARSPYPWGCPWNPYTLGSVMGIEVGYSTSLMQDFSNPLRLKAGRYDVTTTIAPAYTSLFGIADADAERRTRLIVKAESFFRGRPAIPKSPIAQPAAHEPRHVSGGLVAGPTPDLRSLPAFGIGLNRNGTVLRFAATVWNAGDSPLVVDGFRSEDEDHLDAYQYFFDSDGNQTGYQAVGEMNWHDGNHQHWHFEDFAKYKLLAADLSRVAKSRKQSFCLANTDAVDYTRPAADWRPENTDLSTACGGRDALSVRQVLSAGSGDTYLQYRAGQAFRIKNLPNGVYHIAVVANPMRNLVESDTDNNDALRRIRIGGRADNRWVRVPQVGIVEETLPDFFRR